MNEVTITAEELEEVGRILQTLTRTRQTAEVKFDTKEERLAELRPKRDATEAEIRKEFSRTAKDLPAWMAEEFKAIQELAAACVEDLKLVTGA